MVFRQILLPILILVAVNLRLGLALPHQTIRFSFEKYAMQYAETAIKDAIEMIQRVDCPDGLHQCPDGTTCCKANDGGYGCCSMSDAVCCKDGLNCCPHANFCCLPFGCCPYINGVCCKDGSCCPHGFQCDDQHDDCISSHFLPMLVPMKIWNARQPISTGDYIQKVSKQKFPKKAILQP